MKKLINGIDDILSESLTGFGHAHRDILTVNLDPKFVRPEQMPRKRGRSPSCPEAVPDTSRCTPDSSGAECSPPPVPVKFLLLQHRIRCWPPPRRLMVARVFFLSSRTTPAMS